MVERVISGGQTGADRGALDAAIDLGLSHGGFCPRGRRAEDGVIPARYQLEETASADYAERTRKNVEAADATVVFVRGEPKRGSALTVTCAASAGKPSLVIDRNANSPFGACFMLDEFLGKVRPRVLNVAGTRESEAPGLAADVQQILRRVLSGIEPCAHLRPLTVALRTAGIPFVPTVSPYAEDGTMWFMCGATFDEPALRARLSLPDTLTYAEYDGRVAGSDATFFCAECKQALLGSHPLYASPDTPRLA